MVWPWSNPKISQQLTAISSQILAVQKQLATVLSREQTIMTEQEHYNADIAVIKGFLDGLGGKLTAIQADLANRGGGGITSLDSLDALVDEVNQLQPQVDALAPPPPGP